jgi:colanic acid/amylovoran biosynthesis glycosyltransferase
MTTSLRIAMFVGVFPAVSETFIVRQIAGLLDAGHQVDIYADLKGPQTESIQPEIARHRLLDRTVFMEMPPECAPYELPVRPWTGDTWVPGAEQPVANWRRLARALPLMARCLVRAPACTFQSLRTAHYGYRARSLSALHRLATLVRQPGGYDVLHAHFGPVGESFRFARQLWKAPLLVSFHGYDFSTVPRREGRDIYQRLFATADRVTVNSRYTHEELERLHCPIQKLHQLAVGLDPREFPFRERAASEAPRFITVARLVEIKGHEYCLRALALVRARHPNIGYDIVGDGPCRAQLEALATELGLNRVVRFHGALSGDAVRALLQQAHLFLLCSVSVEGDQEGQGLALQEAQACGLPVIATRHGALPEGMREGQSGLLVPERDVPALAHAMEELLNQPERWPDFGQQGRRLVEERFDIRELNRQLITLYHHVMDDFRSRGQRAAHS